MIPKILHQIWVGHDPVPDEFLAYRETWVRLHPHWRHYLWTQAYLPALENRACFDAAPDAAKADVARYEVVYQLGGVYADLDTEALKCLDPLLDCDLFLVWESTRKLVGTTYFGAEAGHPFIRRAITAIPGRFSGDDPSRLVGHYWPSFLTEIYRQHVAEVGPVNVYPGILFFPYFWNQPERRAGPHPQSYAVHHWARSGRS